MGKAERGEHNLPITILTDLDQNVEPRFSCCDRCKWIPMLIGLRCILLLILSVAVFLSVLFWLPPFLQLANQTDLDLDSRFKDHVIVASFNIKTPVYSLKDNVLQLENDIFDEIGLPSTKVVVLSIEPSASPNITKVVFGVDPETKHSKISPTALSLIKASFESLVIYQSSLRLTPLFAAPFFFEVLKFPGGITVIPPQSAFLLQKVQIIFNFTLNYSIYQIQVNFSELKNQLKLGLHLEPYENVYIRLSNYKGSTISPPTIVQSSVLLTVGTPSMPRLKQLAQTITGSHSRNLGLNNTEFGRVKQVQLSSILQHSLHGGDGSVTSLPPSHAPLSLPHNHEHHHNHHCYHHSADLAPDISPTPASKKGSHVSPKGAPAPAPTPTDCSPAPEKQLHAPEESHNAEPPECQTRNKRRPTSNDIKHCHLAPDVAPKSSRFSAGSPRHPPALPLAPNSGSSPASSPLPNVVYSHVQPPAKSESDEQHSNTMSPSSPASPPSSSSGCLTVQWTSSLMLAIILQL